MTTPQAGDQVSLHELELSVRTELTLAETGQPGGEYAGVPDEEQWPDPDAERYETALRSLLGAVETLEQGEEEGLPDSGTASAHVGSGLVAGSTGPAGSAPALAPVQPSR